VSKNVDKKIDWTQKKSEFRKFDSFQIYFVSASIFIWQFYSEKFFVPFFCFLDSTFHPIFTQLKKLFNIHYFWNVLWMMISLETDFFVAEFLAQNF
jgi:hypothetical protein